MNVIVFLLMALATPVFGQLKWENLEHTINRRTIRKLIVATYRFTNIGTTPAKITDLRTSCWCATAYLEKKEYAPGESGEIARPAARKWSAVESPVKRISITLSTLPSEIPERFRFGQRDRHHAFRDRWLPGLAKSEIDRGETSKFSEQ